MKERPILFSAPMVRAILEGRKTQTRRIVKPSIVPHIEFMGGSNEEPPEFDFIGIRYDKWKTDSGKEMPAEWLVYCTEYLNEGVIPIGQLYGAVGDRLWVRETFYIDLMPYDRGPLPKVEPTDEWKDSTYYRADGECCQQIPECCCYEVGPTPWRPSIHMPRWASRILLEIVSVRVERLQDISNEDVLAEGVHRISHGREGDFYHYARTESHPNNKCYPDDAYRELWESINGSGSWDANPWVWVIEFKAIKP